MLSFFMILMTVSSAPLDLVNKKQTLLSEIMSHPRSSQVLLQNETLLSELAEADPGTLETIIGLLNGLLGVSEAASLAFTTDVNDALAEKEAKQGHVATCVLGHEGAVEDVNAANLTLIAAISDERQAAGAVTDATSDFDEADRHHTAMVYELNDKQPGVDAESETLKSTIALIRTLLPEIGIFRTCSYGSVINNKFSNDAYSPEFLDGKRWNSFHSFEEADSLCVSDPLCTGLFWLQTLGGNYSAGGNYQLRRGTQLSGNNDWDFIPATCTA